MHGPLNVKDVQVVNLFGQNAQCLKVIAQV